MTPPSSPAPAIPVETWKQSVAPYVGPDAAVSIFQLISTLGLLAACLTGMYVLLERAPWAAVLIALPTAGMMVRTFIIMHDCAHGSFLPWRGASEVVGFVTGVLTLTPFDQWRRDHALHHASSGDLDRRGHGDVPTLTVREYLARTPRQRLIYRIIRHPLALLLVGPLHLALGQRLRSKSKATTAKQIANVWWTNIAIVALASAAIWLFGWRSVFLVYLPAYYVAASAGVWLFYVQHQFEDAYWEPHESWNYVEASLRGSSHLRLHPILQWFTGNIGLHHIHHLAPKIPNYKLQACHDENPEFQIAPVVTVRTGASALRLTLWDEERRRLIRFDEVGEVAAVGAVSPSR